MTLHPPSCAPAQKIYIYLFSKLFNNFNHKKEEMVSKKEKENYIYLTQFKKNQQQKERRFVNIYILIAVVFVVFLGIFSFMLVQKIKTGELEVTLTAQPTQNPLEEYIQTYGGPGGCKSVEECGQYCGLVEHYTICKEFARANALTR